MTQSLELPVQEFCLDWTLAGEEGRQVAVTLSGQVSLLDNNRFYKIDGVVYVTEGDADIRAVGNPCLSVRRNGVEKTGRQWGWEMCSARKRLGALTTMEGYFVRTGYWAPADRAIQLGLCAESGWSRRKSYSPHVTVRMVD
ncbi:MULTISPECIES: hypothetical protein [unclassified Amycolatopsis]|uniref:hypothetical protein n=1 Tax=unclassified Amycolatopsis TaxID=2618356 RepID=UPI001FF4F052|nr:hypothetical protein [Amycolatopsis sp. FBCC-B4732]UOX89022.1 hypothetical protein MUY14_46425 [Amycolatopsis sp. FBCC-B4732]